jgi:hypothetical protein
VKLYFCSPVYLVGAHGDNLRLFLPERLAGAGEGLWFLELEQLDSVFENFGFKFGVFSHESLCAFLST